ncbi:putative adrenomedullin-5-like protein [Hippopotamus amphibius kiboko]|uniref:putative adrenomedullin-5-like protein n=1 Tax=Hippopotamus amphibius kiboko TaxID=575201 RepID=UPI002593AB4F|nr:putative adrenomedullin-5-like protein [Hippopotamus amphibius kiboko]
MTDHIFLLLLLASSVLGDPDSAGRRTRQQVSQQRGRLCSLGTCQTHRLSEIIYWLRSASTKELSGKAGRKPQDPHSYGRRRRRAVRVQLRLQDPSLRQGGQRSA